MRKPQSPVNQDTGSSQLAFHSGGSKITFNSTPVVMGQDKITNPEAQVSR